MGCKSRRRQKAQTLLAWRLIDRSNIIGQEHDKHAVFGTWGTHKSTAPKNFCRSLVVEAWSVSELRKDAGIALKFFVTETNLTFSGCRPLDPGVNSTKNSA